MQTKSFDQWIWCAMDATGNEILSYFLVFISVVLTVVYIRWLKYIRTLPPGPWGLPIFGYLRSMKGNLMHLRYSELAKKYGSIFSVRLGNQLVVVLSNYRVIRDAFRREDFTGRPHTEFTNILDGYGVINTDGAMWKDQRRFLQDRLRKLGMTFSGASRILLESRITYEVDAFLRRCSMRRGAPTDISTSLSMSISNVICSLIMGVRFHHHNSQFKRFMDLIQEGFKLFASVASINYIPIMRYVPWKRGIRNKISQNREEMANFFQETIDEHRETFDKNNPRDLLDAYLIEIQQAEEENRANQLFQGKNHDRQMQQILGDLFSAGMETVKTTLEWAIVLMLHNPEAARAVQEELDEVVGRSRKPTMADLAYLPITDATICEILRRSSVVPLGTTHATTR
ncbi:cytochrome p450 18a1, partial [Lasius niger]